MWASLVVEGIMAAAIGLLELILFFVAFFIPLPLVAALLLVALSLLYGFSLTRCISISKESSDDIYKFFSFPAFLLLFYLMSPDAGTKFAIIAFAAQGTLKSLYVIGRELICSSAAS